MRPAAAQLEIGDLIGTLRNGLPEEGRFGGTPNMARETHALPVHPPPPLRLRRDESAFDGMAD